MKKNVWILGVVFLAVCAMGLRAQQKAAAPAKPSAGIAAEFLEQWNHTGAKLVGMAQDFPEDKFDYKATASQRTFAEQLLHVAGANYYFIAAASGAKPPEDDSSFLFREPT